MNIVIGSTIQTFEQENEEIWHLEKRNRVVTRTSNLCPSLAVKSLCLV